jgi:hypothetical protein
MNQSMIRAGVGMVVALTSGWAAAQPFQRLIGTPVEEQAYHVERTFDGGMVTTGFHRAAAGGPADVLVVRHAPDGSVIWSITFGTPDTHEIGYSVRQTIDGGFIVACETDLAAGVPLGIGLIRLGPAGNVLWARIYPGTPHSDIMLSPLPGVAVRELRDGSGFIVVGHRVIIATGERGVAIRTDPAGAPVFAMEYMDSVLSSQTQLSFTDVRETVDTAGTRVFDISGTFGALSPTGARDRDVFFMRISGAGAPIFARRYASVPAMQETGDGFDSLPSPTSSIYVVGRTDYGSGGTTVGTQVIRLNPVGGLVDARRMRQLDPAYAAVRLDTAGDLVFTGRMRPTGGPQYAFLQRFDTSAGVPMWTMLYNWGAINAGEGVCVFPGPGPLADTYAVAGLTIGAGYGGTDEYLIRTDPVGGTGPTCPDTPYTAQADQPPLTQVALDIIPIQLPVGTFWQGPMVITLRDSLGCAPPTCDPDVNCDGNVDQDDVTCLINVIAGNPGCACVNPDFNQDGNVDQDDVTALINVVAGGPCP